MLFLSRKRWCFSFFHYLAARVFHPLFCEQKQRALTYVLVGLKRPRAKKNKHVCVNVNESTCYFGRGTRSLYDFLRLRSVVEGENEVSSDRRLC